MTGSVIPGTVNSYLASGGSALTSLTASVDPRFRLPTFHRITLSADYTFFGVNFHADYLFNKAIESVAYTDLRSIKNGILPDGRPRYTFRPTLGATGPGGIGPQTADNNGDTQITNTSQGRSHIGVVSFDKTFDFGLSLSGAYTYQDVKDVSNAASSIAGGLYAGQLFKDPNNPAYGISADQTKWSFRYGIGYDHAWFRDYRTVVQLFGETRAGRPYSFTMNDSLGSNRAAVFGTLASNFLLYVPTGLNDPVVSYDTPATQTSLDGLISSTALKKYRGQIADKNIGRSRANTQLDLHLEQEIPTFIGRSRVALFADILNFPNLLNKNWGGLYQVGSQTAQVVQVTCLTAAGVANTDSTQQCATYRYSKYADPTQIVNFSQSLYLIRIGARFKF